MARVRRLKRRGGNDRRRKKKVIKPNEFDDLINALFDLFPQIYFSTPSVSSCYSLWPYIFSAVPAYLLLLLFVVVLHILFVLQLLFFGFHRNNFSVSYSLSHFIFGFGLYYIKMTVFHGFQMNVCKNNTQSR